jgi:hypothetical protein
LPFSLKPTNFGTDTHSVDGGADVIFKKYLNENEAPFEKKRFLVCHIFAFKYADFKISNLTRSKLAPVKGQMHFR